MLDDLVVVLLAVGEGGQGGGQRGFLLGHLLVLVALGGRLHRPVLGHAGHQVPEDEVQGEEEEHEGCGFGVGEFGAGEVLEVGGVLVGDLEHEVGN